MNVIYDANGVEVDRSSDDQCPKCGRTSKDRVKHQSFGGFWRILCACGFEISAGREQE